MHIKIEDLAPKKIINFYLPDEVTAEGETAVLGGNVTGEGFLQNILQTDGVRRVLLAGNVLSLQYDSGIADDIRALTLAEIDDFLTQDTAKEFVSNVEDIEKVEALADALIRPTLNRDKGDINILSLQNGILTLEFSGHCAGCPYAQNTLQNVIMKTIRHHMPQIKEVRLREE